MSLLFETPSTDPFAQSGLRIDAEAIAARWEHDGESRVYLPDRYVPGGSKRVARNERQRLFLQLNDVREVLYGGAAGGGKSDALLMAALQYIDRPNYAAILFRKTYTDLSLPGALMERAQQWLRHTDARWNDNKKTWRFPSGATLTFAFLKTENDKYRYQSAEFNFIGFDELTQFSELDYRYLFSRLRREEDSDIPSRMRAASNPGGVGHRWVKERFIEPWQRDEETDKRKFVPAKLSDNPHVDQSDYLENLAELDDHTRQQLEDGDWDARLPGPYLYDHHGLDAAFELGAKFDALCKAGKLPPPVGGLHPLGIDFGESTHVLLGWPLEHGGMYVRKEYTYQRGNPDSQAASFWDSVAKWEFEKNSTFIGRQRFDSSKPESMRLWLRGIMELIPEPYRKRANPSPIAFNKYKRQTILHHRKMLEQTQKWLGVYEHPLDPDKNITEPGQPEFLSMRLALSRKGCPTLHEQIYDVQFKDEDTEDVLKENDHGPDALIALDAPLSAKGAE